MNDLVQSLVDAYAWGSAADRDAAHAALDAAGVTASRLAPDNPGRIPKPSGAKRVRGAKPVNESVAEPLPDAEVDSRRGTSEPVDTEG